MKHFILILGILLLFLSLLIPGKSKLRKIYKSNTGELFILSSLWMLYFILLMVFRPSFIPFNDRICLLLFMLLEFIWIMLTANIIIDIRSKSLSFISKHIKNNLEIIVVLALILFIGIIHMNIVPMYDSNLYYGQFIKGLQGLSFGFQSFFDAFTVWGKQYQPIAPLLLLGENISAGTARGIYIVNILLLMGAVICVYRIAVEDFKNITKCQSAILGLIFGCSPFVMSGVVYLTPDFYCAIFFAYMVYFYKKKWIWLFSYAALSFICMKRNMVVTYIIFLIIAELNSKKLSWSRIKQIIAERPLFLYILPMELMFFFFSFGRKSTESMVQGQNTLLQKSVNRFFQAFVFGYKWLCILLFVIALTIMIKKYGIKAMSEKKERYILELAIVISSLAQFVIYQIFSARLTLCSRYYAQNALMYTILIAFVLNNRFLWKRVRTLLGVLVATLYIIQLDIVIDPSMIVFADSIEFCDGRIYLSTTRYKNETIGIGDNMSYNFDYTLWNDIFLEMLSDYKWEGDIRLYASVDDAHLLGCDDFRYGITYNELYNVYWDSNKNRITYIDDGMGCHKISITSLMDKFTLEQKDELCDQDVIYLIIPDNMDDTMKKEICKLGYKDVESKEYRNDITKLELTKLQKY